MKTPLILTGAVGCWESEGGFGPIDVEIDGISVAQAIAAWLGVYVSSDRGGSLAQEGYVSERVIRITVEEVTA